MGWSWQMFSCSNFPCFADTQRFGSVTGCLHAAFMGGHGQLCPHAQRFWGTVITRGSFAPSIAKQTSQDGGGSPHPTRGSCAAFWAQLAAKTPPRGLQRAPQSSSGARCFVTLALWQTALKPASPSRGCDVGIVAFSSAQAGPRLLLLQRFILTAGGGLWKCLTTRQPVLCDVSSRSNEVSAGRDLIPALGEAGAFWEAQVKGGANSARCTTERC